MELFFATSPLWLSGFVLSLGAGLLTALGAIPIFFVSKISERLQDAFLGFGAGVMLAATSFSLIVPALDAGDGGKISALVVVFGILLGGAFLFAFDILLPHQHFVKGVEGISSVQLKKIWLFVFAIIIHNFPEGLAVGVGTGTQNFSHAFSLALGIGLQNIPEGLVVALALLSVGYAKKTAFLVSLFSGLVEPIGGLFGAGLLTIMSGILPLGLAFAAGAMLFVVSNEIIPESHSREYAREATFGVMMGFVLMLFLDVTLG